jgi:hypothetical protein
VSRRSRDKGNRRELEVLHLAQDAGFAATKTSGMFKSG